MTHINYCCDLDEEDAIIEAQRLANFRRETHLILSSYYFIEEANEVHAYIKVIRSQDYKLPEQILTDHTRYVHPVPARTQYFTPASHPDDIPF